MLVREPEPPTIRARAKLAGRLREIPPMLRADPALARFYMAAALAALGTMAVPFYVLYSGERIGLSGTNLGILSTAFLLAQTGANLGWGTLADRIGNRVVFMSAVGLWAVSTFALLFTNDILGLALVFAGLGAGQGGFQNSNQNIIVEFGARDDLPMRIAVLNTATSLMMAMGPLLGGFIARGISFTALFSLSIAVLAAAVIMMVFVDEPRKRPPEKLEPRN